MKDRWNEWWKKSAEAIGWVIGIFGVATLVLLPVTMCVWLVNVLIGLLGG